MRAPMVVCAWNFGVGKDRKGIRNDWIYIKEKPAYDSDVVRAFAILPTS